MHLYRSPPALGRFFIADLPHLNEQNPINSLPCVRGLPHQHL